MHNSVNLERIKEVALGDDDFARELIGIFLEDSTRSVEALASAVEAGGWDDGNALAHRLKGAAANVGAERLEALCASLEAAAGEGRSGDSRASMTELAEEFGRVKRFLTDYAARPAKA